MKDDQVDRLVDLAWNETNHLQEFYFDKNLEQNVEFKYPHHKLLHKSVWTSGILQMQEQKGLSFSVFTD